ncbi:MAG: hypothetical protein M0P71_16325 [Melioribacteraceae bacterium]|nr:hypothetical protein [Melioribacteraceae bacterium]
MKRLLIILFVVVAFTTSEGSSFYRGGAHEYFYKSLSPYGNWVEVDYDVWVWQPYQYSNSWRPYSDGRWIWTSDGWYWDSYEPYGWATYHYGRWVMDDYYGWIWIPDTNWGPAWVNWHYDDYAIGWVPMQPIYSIPGLRISINFRFNYNYWNIVSYNRFLDRDVNRYYYTKQRTNSYFNRNYGKNRQIDMRDNLGRDRIERKLRTTIREVRTTETDRLRDVESRDRTTARTTDRAYKMDISKLRDDYDRSEVKTERTQTERINKDADNTTRTSRGTVENSRTNRTENMESSKTERTNTDRATTERATFERPKTERSSERTTNDSSVFERKSNENKSTERPKVNRSENSRSNSERPTVDRSSKNSSERPSVDRSSRSSSERPQSERSSRSNTGEKSRR